MAKPRSAPGYGDRRGKKSGSHSEADGLEVKGRGTYRVTVTVIC